jgi:endonuclease I
MQHSTRDRALWRPSRLALRALALTILSATAIAQGPPPGYYSSVDDSNSTALRSTLHAVIDDHFRFPYTSGGTDTWDILAQAQIDPGAPGKILDVYKNESYSVGSSSYNREHTWPKSYGFPIDTGTNYPYTDCHMLFLCNGGYNTVRSNKPFRTCTASCSEYTTASNNGQGGGCCVYPGNSNWTSGSFTSGTWEVWMGRRGDVARAIFYADLRYEGGTHGPTGASEPNLVVTNNESLINNSNTGSNESLAYMGMKDVLLLWHAQDPVDSLETFRNDVVFSYQGNRNPFVDNPNWVDCLYSGVCNTGPPSAPTGLVASAGDAVVTLNWDNNPEPDLAGYNVKRSTTSGGSYTTIASLVVPSDYSDTTVSNGTTYYYVVTAEDNGTQESPNSTEVSADPSAGGGGGTPWINEFHYDNVGGDTGEFFEIAGPAGTDLTNWQVLGYNGNGGVVYSTVFLSGTLPNQNGCIGTLSFNLVGMQNGSPDGLALIDDLGLVVQFISYEGQLVASSGPAAGMTSEDVGVAESNSTPIGRSLQLGGTGSQYSDFTWQAAQAETPSAENAGQTFSGGCGGPVNYCTAGASANGCQGSISVAGTASASAVSGFTVTAAGMEGLKDGLFFFGSNGRQANSWGSGTSYQCVVPPVLRAGLLPGSGTSNACDGLTAQDLNALWCGTCPKPGKNPGSGAVVQAQFWYRDPFNTSNQTTSLSDAIEFTVAP